jgi:hypothetical protein
MPILNDVKCALSEFSIIKTLNLNRDSDETKDVINQKRRNNVLFENVKRLINNIIGQTASHLEISFVSIYLQDWYKRSIMLLQNLFQVHLFAKKLKFFRFSICKRVTSPQGNSWNLKFNSRFEMNHNFWTNSIYLQSQKKIFSL